jgi:outer membrane protein, multidrug efflux system
MHSSQFINYPFKHLVAAGIVALLCSCGSTGTQSRTQGVVTVPANWQHSPSSAKKLDTAELTTWWKLFHDPVLNTLVADALSSSPDVRTAASRIAEYRARRGIEKANLFPSLNAGGSGSGTRTRNNTTHLTTTNESYGGSLDASWQVDLFGRQFQTLKAASADLEQITENFYGVQVTLAADIATAYVTLRSAEAQLVVVRNSLGTRSETVQLTEWQERAGTGNALDTQQAISVLEQARATIPTLQLTISQTKNQIALLSGKIPGSLDSQLAASRPVPALSVAAASGIPAETLRQRPDVRAAERGVQAAYARTKAARRERFPTLNLTGSIGIEALKAGHLFSPESTLASLLGSLAAPIFDAGRIRQKITIQSEVEKQALINYERTVLTALSEVENALIGVQRYNEQLAILVRAIAAAREAAKLSALQYKAGAVDLLISLDAQRTLLSLEVQQVSATEQRANASIQLYKALGGGWTHQ